MPLSEELLNAIDHYVKGEATTHQKQLVNNWYHSFSDELVEVSGTEKYLFNQVENALRARLSASTGVNMKAPIGGLKSNIYTLSRIAAAAVILNFLSIGTYFIFHKKQASTQIVKYYDVAPGGNKARLSLASGKKIIINNQANGLIASQANVKINKHGSGDLKYQNVRVNKNNVILFDTLTTPNGGIAHVVLADGTAIWLNAATSVRYPENFPGNERKVELLSGEAYFEVAHDPTKPFSVSANGQTVKVLGTHFNINTYKDDGLVRTTLLQGTIRLTNGQSSGLLKPGEQAVTSGAHSKINIINADTEDVMAWRNGRFKFDNASLNMVLYQLERWYGVSVEINGAVPDARFSGGTYMNKNLSEVLKVLDLNGIHCRIEGRKIIVNP
jgi:transmembrane sensor